MSTFKYFFRDFGMYRSEHLKSPPTNNLRDFELPRGSVFHYLPEDSVVKGIPSDHWGIRNAQRLVMVEHITELSSDAKEGRPRQATNNAKSQIRAYHRRHRKLKESRSLSTSTRDDRTVLVENYGILPDLYRYTQSYFTQYYRWMNIFRTMAVNLNRVGQETGRQQFISMSIPTPLPSLSEIRQAEDKVTRERAEMFSSPEALMVLEVWKWLGDKRDTSIFATLSKEDVQRINLIWRHENRWVVMNLGVLDDWRKGEDGEGFVDPQVMQKHFLRVLMALFETATPTQPPKRTKIKEGEEEEEESPKLTDDKDDPSKLQEDIDDEDLDKELDGFNEKTQREAQAEKGTNPLKAEEERTLSDGVVSRADAMADEGLISAAEYKRFDALAKKHETLPDPRTGKGSLVESSKIDPKTLLIEEPTKFADDEWISDKSMLETTLQEFDSRYVNDVLPKDVSNMVLGFQNAGAAVTDYQVETIKDVANTYEAHTVRLTPVNGKSSTLRFKIPVVDEEGTFLANGVKYRMRKQRADLPIRKVKPTRVALTSYYGKVFVDRSEKTVNNYGRWLTKELTTIALDDDDNRITNLKSSDVSDHTLKIPRPYAILSETFVSFTLAGIDFFFDYHKREERFGEDVVKKAEKKDLVVVGAKKGTPVLMDTNGAIYVGVGKDQEVQGRIEDLASLDMAKAPVDVAELKVFSKSVPMGVALAYYVGLDTLIDYFDSPVKRVPSGERVELSDEEFAIKFDGETLVVDRNDRLASLLLGGFREYKHTIKRYAVDDFNKKDVYYNVLTENGMGAQHLRELQLMRDMFIDPITKEILAGMEEPTTWLPLLMRAAELLLTDYSPTETDMDHMRIRGYERIAGAVYTEMVNSLRAFNSREGNPEARVEMKPFAVWQTINSDPSVSLIEDRNPIQNLKEKEAVTFTGEGGRSKVSMVARTRVFGDSDMGVISEATTDDGNVGINNSMSANPKYTSLRGMTAKYDKKEDGAARLVSTSALLSPSADRDDPKRVNFISIQHAQGISAKGYQPTPLRTGYERVIPHRVSDLYAYTAKKSGKVTKVTKEAVTVEYEDGETVIIQLGRRFGKAADSIYPHEVITNLQVGDKVKEGDGVTYNPQFFTPDPLDNRRLVWKAGVMCRTAIYEATDTFEDSSAISERIANEMRSDITHTRELIFSFDQVVRQMVEVGSVVDSESILCIIEDSVTADSDMFDDETYETLRLLSANSPKAKYGGTVEKIEVLYHGDKEDMSESLRKLADQSDRALAKERRAMGQEVVTGGVDDTLRVNNKSLELDSMVVRVYITQEEPTGIGDKGVFGNQMKTIFARVMSGTNETESGEEIDAVFGYQSISNRILLSPEIAGTTNTLMRVLSKRVADVYFNG